MPRSLLIICLILDLALSALVGAVVVLAPTAAVQPDSALFPLQDLAEQVWAGIVVDPPARPRYQIQLASQRARELQQLAGSAYELNGLQALNQALDRYLLDLAGLPSVQRASYQPALEDLSTQVNQALHALRTLSDQHSGALQTLMARWNAFRTLAMGEDWQPDCAC